MPKLPRPLASSLIGLTCLVLGLVDCVHDEDEYLAAQDLPEVMGYWTCVHVSDLDPPFHECSAKPFSSAAQCENVVRPIFEDSVQAALDAGLHYSPECVDRVNDFFGPPQATSGTWLDCERDCQFLHGDQPEGASCESFGHRMSDCAQGLVCAPDRTCHQPCGYSFVSPVGGFCGPARGMWFVTCEPGLVCGPDGICEPAAGVGAACDAATACAVEGWCNPDSSVCEPRLTAESPCGAHEHCLSDLCVDGICVEPQWFECGRWGW